MKEKYIAVLGRLPKISVAELTRQFGDSVRQISPSLAVFSSEKAPDINRFGGSVKFGRLILNSPVDYLLDLDFSGKFTIGISDYSRGANRRKSQAEAMKIKKIISRHGRNCRVLANSDAVLSSATSHHNQMGEKPGHIEFIKIGKEWYVLTGVQNITAYKNRDQARPARDAKVGMLPPKLAQILINLLGPLPAGSRILDPFCGTGVLLQEALLDGYSVYGTDLSERMIEYSEKNLKWLNKNLEYILETGDAINFKWNKKIDGVACETYLGAPMSTPPVEIKLKTEKQECLNIILGFLKNISSQIEPNTPLVLAVPAWLRPSGKYERLAPLDAYENLGYNVEKLNALSQEDMLYFREGQIVAREIIILRKK